VVAEIRHLHSIVGAHLGTLTCSGSPTVGVGLANGGRFGLTLCDKGLDGWLMLNDNGLTLADKGSPTAQPAHAC
jgi:hypothetical protein